MPKIKDRIKELRRVKASDLIDHPKNWREHPPEQRKALEGILKEIGFADVAIVRETPEGLQLIDGHLRKEFMGDQEIPVIIVDLDADEADKMLVTLDPLAALADVNDGVLRDLLSTIDFQDEALAKMVESLVKPIPPATGDDPGAQIDKAEELREKWGVERGQVWEIGNHRLMCGDAADGDLDTLMDVTATMVWADPPYGVAYVGKTKDALTIQNDSGTGDEMASLWAAVFTSAANHANGDLYIAAPAGPPMTILDNTLEQTPWERHQWLVWVKNSLVLGRSNYHYRHEQIWYGWLRKGKSSWAAGRNQDSVFDVPRPSRSDEHPTMKPVELVSRMVENSSDMGEVVLDPFLGSGTTMVACEQLGRICYGMEIEPKYVAVTLERMSGMGLEPRLITS